MLGNYFVSSGHGVVDDQTLAVVQTDHGRTTVSGPKAAVEQLQTAVADAKAYKEILQSALPTLRLLAPGADVTESAERLLQGANNK